MTPMTLLWRSSILGLQKAKDNENNSGDDMSVDFFGIGGPGQIGDLKKTQENKQGNKAKGTNDADTVQFSSVLQDVHKAREAAAGANAERAQKVATLKEQVAEGSYQPDLQKVATSLLQFIVEEK